MFVPAKSINLILLVDCSNFRVKIDVVSFTCTKVANFANWGVGIGPVQKFVLYHIRDVVSLGSRCACIGLDL